MTSLELIIGNKNYSSWSMRPWIAMKVMEIPFSETMARLEFEKHNAHLLDYSPSQNVPVLKDGEMTVWDSLAILEYIAELNPQKRFWPRDPARRARARSISCQMHSSFADLRNECPMNMRRSPRTIEISNGVKRDVAQIETLWRAALDASGGPFLFGDFTIADAMYAPVVNRFLVYELSTDPTALAYGKSITTLPAWQEWAASSRQEKWTIEHAEV